MVQFLSINFFSSISSIFVGFSKVPFFCATLYDVYFYLGKNEYDKLKRRGVLHIEEKMKLRYCLKEWIVRLRMYGSASRSVSNSSYYKRVKDKRQGIYLQSQVI